MPDPRFQDIDIGQHVRSLATPASTGSWRVERPSHRLQPLHTGQNRQGLHATSAGSTALTALSAKILNLR